MTGLLIGGYVFIAVATFIALMATKPEVFPAAFWGILWPVFFMVALILKLIS